MSQACSVASSILDRTCLARGEKVKVTRGEGRSTYKENSGPESISDSVLAINPRGHFCETEGGKRIPTQRLDGCRPSTELRQESREGKEGFSAWAVQQSDPEPS